MRANLQTSFNIKNVSASEFDVEIFDVIGQETDWWTGETFGISFEEFRANWINAIKSAQRVNIRVNSVGGDVQTGNHIFNLISETAAKNNIEVHTYIDGVAYSMAAILIQAAPKGNRHSAANGLYMLHAASLDSLYSKNATQLREVADLLDKYDNSLAISLAKNLGITTEEVMNKYFDGKDRFFTAEEMLAEGLIDHIENYKADIVTTARDYSLVRNEYLKAAAKKQNPTSISNLLSDFKKEVKDMISKISNKINPEPVMNLQALYDKLSASAEGCNLNKEETAAFAADIKNYLAAKHTDADVQAAVDKAVKAKEEEMQAQIDELQAKVDEKQVPPVPADQPDPEPKPENTYVPMNKIKI